MDLPLPAPPAEATRRNVFVINDIDLVVPPSQIQVHQEDLLYNWKTLRSNASTKIATGHGQIRVSISIQFTNAMILDLHRLIVQMRHSPFCSIKNSYLRESIVPQWPDYQEMAFTMTSIHVSPIPGLSDSWTAELDLLWFNYFPYLHNYLYREDWNTNWISLDTKLEQDDRVKLSIGWELDTESHDRKIRLSTIDIENNSDAEGVNHLNWSALEELYSNYDRRTIFDMEKLHFGESFDLLPLPGNMEPSAFVRDARNSRIYTRYINYLQRDAMIENFGFNPEETLGKDASAYFSIVDTDEGPRTYGLHTGLVPNHVRSEWITRMLDHNRGVDFHFHAFKDIRLPAKWTKVLRDSKNNSIKRVVPAAKQGSSKTLQPVDHDGNPKGAATEVRNGWWDPVGKFTPIGSKPGASGPIDIKDVVNKVTSRVSLRDSAKDAKLYSNDSRRASSTKGSRVHKGTDFGVAVGTPIFAVADGMVTSATRVGARGEGVRWEWIDTSSTGVKRGLVRGSAYLEDWEQTITESGTNNLKINQNSGFFGPRIEQRSNQAFGSFTQSITDPNIWYIANYTSGGQQITIRHNDGSLSRYMHVDEILVTPSTRVLGGQQIGTSGRTSSLADDFLKELFSYAAQDSNLFQTGDNNYSHLQKVDPENPGFPDDAAPNDDSPYSLKPHLHFEYHEVRNIPNPNVEPVNGMAAPNGGTGLVLVDPVPSWESAKYKDRPDIEAVLFENQVDESIADGIESGFVEESEAADFRNLLTTLNNEGWVYYEDDSSISNVWRKQVSVSVQNQNGAGPSHVNDTAILANASGGLRHVVANIPILSHEYPTQQHLGSVEPTYNIEFTIRNDSTDLAGLSEKGKSLQGMRSLLQSNARKFRPIVDAWCVGTDTFITRLLGTYKQRDYKRTAISTLGFEGFPGLDTAEIVKRSSIMRSASATVPGSPGVSTISFEVQETNPFDFEKLQPKSIDRVDLDEARKKVLNTLYNLDFLDNVDTQAVALIIAQQAGADVINPDNEAFGSFTAPLNDADYVGSALPNVFIEADDGNGNKSILVRDETGFFGQVMDQVGKNVADDAHTVYGPSADYSGYAGIPVDFLGLQDQEFEQRITDATVNEAGEALVDTTGTVTQTYNLSDWILDGNARINNTNFKKVSEYWELVNDTKHVAERMLAEHSSKGNDIRYEADADQYYKDGNVVSEGLGDDIISQELFDLPMDAKMWRSWQQYVVAEVAIQAGSAGVNEISSSDNWPQWNSELDDRTKREVVEAATGYRFVGVPLPNLGAVTQGLSSGNVFDQVVASIRMNWDNVQAEKRASNRVLVNRYFSSYPLSRQLDTLLESYSYNNLFGQLLGANGDNSQPRAFERFDDHLVESLSESAFFAPRILVGTPEFQSQEEEIPNSPLLGWVNEEEARNDLSIAAIGTIGGPVALKRLNQRQLAGKEEASQFKWIVNQGAEREKVAHFKRVFARIADDILQDADMLEVLGLTELADLTKKGQTAGSDAYPDIVLPYHPFFGDTISVDPDFYMWNVYEDGGALSEEIQDQVKDNVDGVIQNCYNTMQRMQGGITIDPKVSVDKGIILEPGVDGEESLQVTLKYNAEATDEGEYGAMGSPFYESASSLIGVNQFYENLSQEKNDDSNTNALPSANQLKTTKASVRVSNSEGYVTANVAGGVQYPRRLSSDNYAKLADQVSKVESMFGVKEGYQEENLLPDNSPISDRTKGTKLDRVDEFAHSFDPASLQKLALDSSKDIVSQRMTMRRAYPTFKLFFVEEDEFESRTLNFDDFHSYNGVQSFYTEMSRSNPADHAVVTIQNVSGTLDGTKRGAIVDLDYFGKSSSISLPNGASAIGGDSLNQDTASDQPFGAIVLRPGLNVQLRSGYSNDPDNLHVLLSGRIIDVQWNKNGDLAEVMIQSFGTQLVQAIKGTQRDGESEIFYTTHQLLGSLMLEPELTHFGRWEIGQLFQIGESSDYRLDFKDYSRENFLGRFNHTANILQWTQDHPYLALGAYLSTGGGIALGAGAVAIGEGTGLFDAVADSTLGRMKRFFTSQQVSLFLSPQDDNLYPPHPKDYMTLDQPYLEQFTDWVVGSLSHLAGEETTTAQTLNTAYRWWNSERFLLQKKVLPKAAQYQLVSTTIWKVFHEMSIRHPGWIYGARPYGNDFRYTMFFGVPSQRYWARGASNQFIKRANDLNEYLQEASNFGTEQLKFEYQKLYGQRDAFNKTIEDIEEDARASTAKTLALEGRPVRHIPEGQERLKLSQFLVTDTGTFSVENVVPDTLNTTRIERVNGSPFSVEQPVAIEDTPEYKAQLHQSLTGPALKEYLRALNFRFVPFRRYHMFTSERNLVWNGLLSAENAVTNAVDITYFNESTSSREETLSPVASTLFKAHSFIPENQLRVAPVRWPNCKGYNMAMRYGMGELLHRMRNMYRGEILITGNARVRPWDIGILVDSYNDMVGPVEVDQVVHSFSHETGFITEIKPSAVVIGNEISSWPLLEAMQTFALAVIDIEDNYLNLKGTDSLGNPRNDNSDTDAGNIRDIAQTFSNWSSKDVEDLMRERKANLLREGINLEDTVFGGALPESDLIESLINTTEIFAKTTTSVELTKSSLKAAAFSVGAGVLAGNPQAVVAGAGTALGVGATGVTIASKMDFPGLAWLIGGPLLFLQCLRQDSIIVVPIMKGGNPIVSGVSYHDPTMIWNNFRGDVRQYVDDVLDGTRDMLAEYKQFGSHIWNKAAIENLWYDKDELVAHTNLTNQRP